MPKGTGTAPVASTAPKGFAGGGGIERGGIGGVMPKGETPKFSSRVLKESKGSGSVGQIDRFGSVSSSLFPKAEFSKPGVTAQRKPDAFASASEFVKPAGKEPTQAAQKTSVHTRFISTIESFSSQAGKFKPATGENLQQLQQQASEAAMKTLGGDTLRAGQETTGKVKVDGKNRTVEIISLDKPKTGQTPVVDRVPEPKPASIAGELSGGSHQATTAEQIRSFKEQTTDQSVQRINETELRDKRQAEDITRAQSSGKDVKIVEISGNAPKSSQSAQEVQKTAKSAVEDKVREDKVIDSAQKTDVSVVKPPAESHSNGLKETLAKKDTNPAVQQQARPVEQPKEKIADAKSNVTSNAIEVADTPPVNPDELAQQVGDRVSDVKAEQNNQETNAISIAENKTELTGASLQRKNDILHELDKIADQRVAEGQIQTQVISSRIEEIHSGVSEIPTVDLRAIAADEISAVKDSPPKTSGQEFGAVLRRLVTERVAVRQERSISGRNDASATIKKPEHEGPIEEPYELRFIKVDDFGTDTVTERLVRAYKGSFDSVWEAATRDAGKHWGRVTVARAISKSKALVTRGKFLGAIDWDELLKRKKKKTAYEQIVHREAVKAESSDKAILAAQKVKNNAAQQPQDAVTVSSPAEGADSLARQQSTVTESSTQSERQNVSATQQEEILSQLLPQTQPVTTAEQAQQLQAKSAEQITNRLGRMVGNVVFEAEENGRLELKLDENAKRARQEAIIDGVAKAPKTSEETVTGPDVVAAADKKHTDALLSAAVILTGGKQDGGETIVWNNIAQIGELSTKEMMGEALKREEDIRPVAIAKKGGEVDERDLIIALSNVKKTELDPSLN